MLRDLERNNFRVDTLKQSPSPLCSVIKFDAAPIRCCQSAMLQNYVVHRLSEDGKKTRKELMSAVETSQSLNKKSKNRVNNNCNLMRGP